MLPGRRRATSRPWPASPLPVEPRKRSVFVVRCRTPLPGMPLLVEPGGIYIRPEGDVFICGGAEEEAGEARASRR